MVNKPALVVLLVAVVLGITSIGPSLRQYFKVAGVFRDMPNTVLAQDDHLIYIEDTIQCEDIHHHPETNQLFLACEDNYDVRFEWFPPLAKFLNSSKAEHSSGSIHVVDPVIKTSRRLIFKDFDGPFITHGIDVISDPESTAPAVFIFAINHAPDASSCTGSTSHEDCAWRASSRVEVFRHVLGSTTADHVRTVQHPLISTPNDVLALDTSSFLITNDYHHKEGLLRHFELLTWRPWSTAVHVNFQHGTSFKGTEGVKAKVVLDNIYNLNGLGRARDGQIAIGRAGAGAIELAHISPENQTIQITQHLQMDSTVDNPSYFTDPYADESFDGSGYIIAGLAKAADILHTAGDPNALDPSIVWYVPTKPGGRGSAVKASEVTPRPIFQDDGRRLRFSTTAVLVGIDPKLEGGQRWAWLFVTGALAKGAVAVKVNLEALV
ncbi:hypothetical protein F5X68DRAFT_245332 [Plectosphaerella plurivora]|uniref:Serum paraoxonase/arylesterase n=1 Tax=Plectosphaerella plurivora TaxID=936078 RepID=A0A9P9A8Y5_9PEZI|nr:hypothetical protein F5X68DRAFT_245332 [Plectosphaerella plurivora]